MTISKDVESQIAALIEGDSVASILVPHLDHDEREALATLALTRWFDDAIAERLLGPQTDATLTGLVERGFLRRIPSRPERMQPAPDAAEYLSHDRQEDMAAIREQSKQLAAIYYERGEHSEMLYHLLVGDPKTAIAQFESTFEEAYRRFDLAACRSLVEVLKDPARSRLVKDGYRAEILELATRLSGYLTAREQWSHEFHRTVRHFPAQGMDVEWKALLAPTEPRLLQVYAKGGMGKTNQIEWLISQRCVPASIYEPGIPSARIDFDDVNLAGVQEAPWLLLVELARQLDTQTPSLSFSKLLAEHGYHLRAIRRGAAVEVEELSMAEGTRHALRKRFIEAIRSLPDTTVLIVFDTLEVVLENRTDIAGSLRTLLDVLDAEAEDAAPKMRVVLSGRRDLREWVPSDLRRRLDEGRNLELPPFSDKEATAFLGTLLDREKTSDRAPVVAAIVRQSAGVPFKLRLFADTVRAAPDSISAAEIDEIKDPDILYLVERVIERIADPEVRWLVRYGVIPRTLSYDALREIVYPFIRDALQGNLQLDDIEASAPQVRQAFMERLQPDAPVVDEQALLTWWETLKGYASGYSWVSLDTASGNTVRFHSDVLRPMRHTLREQPVAERLHRAAVGYFDRAAKEDPEHWHVHLREAVYHRFQVRARDGVDVWSKAIARARAEGNEEARRDLSRDLLGPDYLDDGFVSQRRNGRVIVPKRVVARALYELADASVELAQQRDAGRGDADWADASWAITELEHLNAGLARPLVPRAKWLRVKAVLEAHDGNQAEADYLLSRAMDKAYEAEDRLAIERTRAAVGTPDAGRFRTALLSRVVSFAEPRRKSIPFARSFEVWGREHLATELEREEQLDKALAHVKDAQKALCAKKSKRETELLIQESRLLAKLGATGLAMRRAEEALGESVDPVTEAEAGRAWMRAVVLHGRPRTAIRYGDEKLTSLGRAREQGVRIARATLLEGFGTATASLCAYTEALKAWAEASALWEAARMTRRSDYARLNVARLQLRSIGSVPDAAQALAELQSESALRRLLELEVGLRQGEGDIDELLRLATSTEGSLQLRLEAAVVGLEVAGGDAVQPFGSALIDALRPVSPASRRAIIVLGLVRGPEYGLCRLDSGTLAKLEGLGGRGRTVNRELIRLGFAELARLIGDSEGARERLAQVDLGRLSGPHLLWIWLMNSFPVATTKDGRWDELIQRATVGSPTPELYGASLALRLASGLAALGSPEEALAVIDQTLRDLAEQPPSVWVPYALRLGARLAAERGDRALQDLFTDALASAGTMLGWGAGATAAPPNVSIPVERATQDHAPGPSTTSISLGNRSLLVAEREANAPTAYATAGMLARGDITGAASFVLSESQDLTAEMCGIVGDLEPPFQLQMEGAVNAMPWEKCGKVVSRVDSRSRARGRLIQSIQIALNLLDHGANLAVDGVLGPRTRKALERHRAALEMEDRELPDLESLADVFAQVRASRDSELAPDMFVIRSESAGRIPMEELHGVDPSWLFAEQGWRVARPDTLGDQPGFLGESPLPSMVYISASLGVRGQGVVLLLGDDLGGRWPVSALDAMLQQSRIAGGNPPLVVIDVPWPGHDLEVVRQLLLRNIYAAELFASGRVLGVLATGLFPPGSFAAYESLAADLGSFESLESILGKLNTDVLQLLTSAPPSPWCYSALFSATPRLSMPPQAQERRP